MVYERCWTLCRDPDFGCVEKFLHERYLVDRRLDLLNLQLQDPGNKDNQQLLNQLNIDKERLLIQCTAFREGRILLHR